MTLYSNIDRIVFGSYAGDIDKTNTYEYKNFNIQEIAKDAVKFDGEPIVIDGGILRKECAALMADHRYWTKGTQ